MESVEEGITLFSFPVLSSGIETPSEMFLISSIRVLQSLRASPLNDEISEGRYHRSSFSACVNSTADSMYASVISGPKSTFLLHLRFLDGEGSDGAARGETTFAVTANTGQGRIC